MWAVRTPEEQREPPSLCQPGRLMEQLALTWLCLPEVPRVVVHPDAPQAVHASGTLLRCFLSGNTHPSFLHLMSSFYPSRLSSNGCQLCVETIPDHPTLGEPFSELLLC